MKIWFYTTRALLRHLRGGWYVWRDTPTDLLIKIVATSSYLKSTDDSDLRSLITEAEKELELRLASELRK